MTAEEIQVRLNELLPDLPVLDRIDQSVPTLLKIRPESLLAVSEKLLNEPEFYFDLLENISGVHHIEEKQYEVIYHFYSIPNELHIGLKVVLSDSNNSDLLPEVDSISHIWKAAEWYERETYDLLGIKFNNHPDLRRILLPADWEGFPLRKDYSLQKYYRGIKVEY
jgi:NADH-quinone oxidoreductase subunit C